MEKLNIDATVSEQLYQENKELVIPKRCYENIYRLSERKAEAFFSQSWKICFGYMSSGATGLYVRHAFILDTATNKVIDPTCIAARENLRSRGILVLNEAPEYYLMHRFDSYDEYISMLLEDGRYSMDDALAEKDKTAFLWAREQGIYLVGADMRAWS